MYRRSNVGLADTGYSKQDLLFKLKVTVTIHELTAIPSNQNKPLFCVFEVHVCMCMCDTGAFCVCVCVRV